MPVEHRTECAPRESRAAKMLREVFDSGRPLTYIRSAEEQRIARVLREVSLRLESTPTPVWILSLTDGMHRDGEAAQAGTQSPRSPGASSDGAAASYQVIMPLSPPVRRLSGTPSSNVF